MFLLSLFLGCCQCYPPILGVMCDSTQIDYGMLDITIIVKYPIVHACIGS